MNLNKHLVYNNLKCVYISWDNLYMYLYSIKTQTTKFAIHMTQSNYFNDTRILQSANDDFPYKLQEKRNGHQSPKSVAIFAFLLTFCHMHASN